MTRSCSGRAKRLVRQAGEVVNAGDPILAVAEAEPTEIVMYVK